MTIWLIALMAALVVCAVLAFRSKRSIRREVFALLVALIPPIFGNVLIMTSSNPTLARIGCYIYYIGLDWTVVMLLEFTAKYCSIDLYGTSRRKILYAAAIIDTVQLLLNPMTGHAFTTNEILVDGLAYFQLVPLAGQAFHRIVAYGIFLVSVAVFVYKVIKSPRLYKERYGIILAVMVFAGAWQTYYIMSGSPVDRSMIGFGVFGLLVFYFSLYYRPVRLLDRMLVRVVSGINDSVFFFDTEGQCIYANDSARELIGIGAEDAIPEDAQRRVGKVINGWQGAYNQDWWDYRHVVDENGEDHYYDMRAQQINDERGRHVGSSLTIRNATDEEKRLLRERHLATHDALTGLYNQQYLYERVSEELEANPARRYYAVGMDVKDFKIVNDIFSKDFGDRVLIWVADWMRTMAARGAVYGRISGDKFGFIVPVESFDADAVNERMRNRSYQDEETGISYPIILHLGVYEVTSEEKIRPSIMFDRAFMAISTIKNDYQKHVAFYDAAMREDVVWRQAISGQLEQAIAERQIRPYLQPMVDKNGKVEGAEVLVRWIHPEEGFLSPARFIPVFEENGMIARLDAHMWECACEILQSWQARGIDKFLSVNISPKDFYFIDVLGTIRSLVDKYGIDPHKLRLEITETVMMSDLENRLRIIEDLRSDGFLVEMDDFGSGYSSLNMLKDIPVDVLKIDMMFLYKTKDQGKAETILQTIINLSRQLGIPSVTEGVETADQLDMLVNMGCGMFQGYYFAKPMPVEEFENLYKAA